MAKGIARIIGIIMLVAAVVFVAFALQNPEMSFPWSNIVIYVLYVVYLIVMVIMFIAPFKKRKR